MIELHIVYILNNALGIISFVTDTYSDHLNTSPSADITPTTLRLTLQIQKTPAWRGAKFGMESLRRAPKPCADLLPGLGFLTVPFDS